MTAKRVCTSGQDNLGSKSCSTGNPFAAQFGIILSTKTFKFDTVEDFASEAAWVAGIKSKEVFPLLDFWDYEDNSVEPTIAESAAQKRKVTRQGEYRFKYMWQLPMCVHKALQSYRNGDYLIFIVDENGRIYGTMDGVTVKGFSQYMINPEKLMSVPSDASLPAISPMTVDYADFKEWNEYLVDVSPEEWNAKTLVALTDVTVEQVSASDTEVVVEVYMDSRWASDGTVLKVPVSGIECTIAGDNDFVTDLTGTVTGITDNGDGTYTIAGSSFVTGTVGLVAPSAMTTEFDDFYIESTGDAVITIS